MSRPVLLGSGASTGTASAIVDTKQGQLRGRRNGTVYEFRGVRYAEPQTAENRFLPPIPLKSWRGVRDALESGPASMQRWGPAGFMNAWAIQKDISEDCLRVNVWTPGLDGNKRPVMFWCHGGFFITGSGSTAAYDGKNLAEFGDVVVVTVTHRLGVFGYLHLTAQGVVRIWALGVQAACWISMPQFDSKDAQRALHSAVDRLAKGARRPTLEFENRRPAILPRATTKPK